MLKKLLIVGLLCALGGTGVSMIDSMEEEVLEVKEGM